MHYNMRKTIKFSLITAAACVALVIAFAIGNATSNTVAKTAVVRPNPPTRAQLLTLVNEQRAKAGVAPLRENSALDVAAQAKAEDETIHGFGHECPGCLNGMLESEKDLGLQGNYGENLTWVPDGSLETAQTAVTWWMGSTPHRTAMLSSKYTLTGFGIIHNGIVEEFYSPQKFTTPTTKSFN